MVIHSFGQTQFSCLDMLLGGALLAYTVKYFGAKRSLLICILMTVLATVFYWLLIVTNTIEPFFAKALDLSSVNGQLFWMLLIPYTCVLLVWLLNAQNLISRFFFTNRLVVYIGKISYGLYLYHYIIFYMLDRYKVFDTYSILSPISKILITIGIAFISWELVEKPILKLKEKFIYKRV